jgi:glycosyltransferase involved in cell wall biosynthesis
MKVVQLLPALNGGGVEKGTLEVAKYLVEQGHESIVVSAGGSMVAQLESEGSRHVSWDLGRKSLLTFRHIWAFRRFLKQERPDILHLRSRMPAWVAWFAWKGLPKASRPKLITTVHGLYSVSKYSQIMCRGEAVIAVSNTVKEYILSNYPDTPPENIKLIYRGVDPAEWPYGYMASSDWKDSFFEKFPKAKGKKILCLPGRLTRLKGHHDFLELMHSIAAENDDVHALIVGGEDPKRKEYANELYRRVKELGLSDRVTFTGARRDIREIFAISEIIYSLSTKPESFGRTVLEALSLGRSVLGYDHGGVGEILAEIYPEGRVQLSSMTSLNKLTCEKLVNRSVPMPASVFTKENMLSATLEAYGSTIS